VVPVFGKGAVEVSPRICLAVRLKKRENSDYFESHPKNPD
jgi:hypothetical protein